MAKILYYCGLVLNVIIFLLLLSCTQQAVPVQEEVKTVPEQPQQLPVGDKMVSVELIDVPTQAQEAETIPLRWKVNSQPSAIAIHTAVHYDTKSHLGALETDVEPQTAGYSSLTKEYASGEFAVPRDFTGKVIVPPGKTLFLRAHVIIEGKHYWTDEKTIKITLAAVPEPVITIKEFTIEGDDVGFYPKEITVKKGDNVKITFVARSQGVYYGGLDFQGQPWGNTGKVKPGNSTTVEFTAIETFQFKSYWPTTKVLKATGMVVVQ